MLYELKIDKELESLCPALSADELKLLEESIESEGCRDEIVLWANHDKTIIDGHNRYRICKRLKLPYKTKSLAFVSKDEVKQWMLRNQMGRRNLSESQRAMAASRLATLSPGNQTGNVSGLTQAEAAAAAGVSDRTIRSAKKVIEHGTPELQKAVTDGEVPVSVAAELADKPKAEQKKIVAKGSEAVKAEARKSKAEKKAKSEADPPAEKPAEDTPIPEVVPIDTSADFDPANIEAHAASLKANLEARMKAHNLELERYAKRIAAAFENDRPESAWLNDSQLGIVGDSIRSALQSVRVMKCDQICPKCGGTGKHTGKPCKWCRGVGFMPQRSYEMAGGQ